MKNKPQRIFRGPTLHDCELVPITDPSEIAVLERRFKAAEKKMVAARGAASGKPKSRKG